MKAWIVSDCYDDDRRFLVKHGWRCVDKDFCTCVNCSSADLCEAYQEHVREEAENENT